MSRRETVPCRVDVAVVGGSALTTGPISYSKPCDTFRPLGWQCATARAGLGGVAFVNFFEQYPCAIAFVPEHGSEAAPAGIEYGFCHPCLGQRERLHVADEYCSVTVGQLGAALLQKIGTTISDLGVDRLDPSRFAGALRHGECWLEVAIKRMSLNLVAVVRGGCGCQC